MADWCDVPTSPEDAEELIYLKKVELREGFEPYPKARLKRELEGLRRFKRWASDVRRKAA